MNSSVVQELVNLIVVIKIKNLKILELFVCQNKQNV